jgi:DNA-directed RNA polymerase subunit RPC12/RpoP
METFETGDKPGKGTYKCLTHRCGRKVTIEKDSDPLPECPKCGKAEFKKIS